MQRSMTRQLVVARPDDGRALMQGSNACSMRWGDDPARALLFAQNEATAAYSVMVQLALEDGAAVMPLVEWRYEYLPARQRARDPLPAAATLTLSTGPGPRQETTGEQR